MDTSHIRVTVYPWLHVHSFDYCSNRLFYIHPSLCFSFLSLINRWKINLKGQRQQNTLLPTWKHQTFLETRIITFSKEGEWLCEKRHGERHRRHSQRRWRKREREVTGLWMDRGCRMSDRPHTHRSLEEENKNWQGKTAELLRGITETVMVRGGGLP